VFKTRIKPSDEQDAWARAADIPVAQRIDFDLVINRTIATAPSLAIREYFVRGLTSWSKCRLRLRAGEGNRTLDIQLGKLDGFQ